MTETGLPPKEDFFSNLTEEGVSEDDYSHAQTVWDIFGMTTFKEYHDLYLMTDVLLLADVVQQFRRLAKREYDLDPPSPLLYGTKIFLGFDAEINDDIWRRNDETSRLTYRQQPRTFHRKGNLRGNFHD